MKSALLRHGLFLLSCLILQGVYAQDLNCTERMQDAQYQYNQGWYDESIIIIEEVLKSCSLNKGAEIEVRKLQIRSFLEIDYIEEAEKAVSNLLKKYPRYEPNPLEDEPELLLIFEKFKPSPMVWVQLQVGMNHSILTNYASYSVLGEFNPDDYDQFQSKSGFQMRLDTRFRLASQISLLGGLQFRQSAYARQIPNVLNETVNYVERLSYIDLPIAAQFDFTTTKFKPFVQVGIQPSFLVESIGELSRSDQLDLVNRYEQRNAVSFGFIGGLGLSYEFKNVGVFLIWNYQYNPAFVNKDGTRYDQLDMIFKYYYLDNDFSMDLWSFQFGVTYVLKYKPINPN